MKPVPHSLDSSVRRTDAVIAAAVILCALVLHQVYLAVAQPDVPFMDTMRLLHLQEAWLEGRMSLYDLWAQGGAHRGLICQALLLANTRLFSLDAMLANRLTGVTVALLCAVLAWAFLRDRDARSPAARARTIAVVGVFALLCFGWAGFETLLLELGWSLWVKNLAFVAFFFAHDRYLRTPQRPGIVATLLLAIAGASIVLFIGMGWAYAFVGAALCTYALAWLDAGPQRADVTRRAVPVAALVVAMIAYTLAGKDDGGAATGATQLGLARLALQPFYAIGSGWAGSEPSLKVVDARWFLLAGMVSVACGAVLLFRRWQRGMRSGALLPVQLMGYAALTAVSVTIARGDAGDDAVMASRYYMDLMLFLVGVAWLWSEEIERGTGRARTGFVAAGAVLGGVLCLAQAWTDRQEWRTAPYRAVAYDAMGAALRRGVASEQDATLLQAPIEVAQSAAAIMRAQKLSVFEDYPGERCSVAAIAFGGGWNAGEPQGRWMAQEADIELPACECQARTTAYIPEGFAPRVLRIQPVPAAANQAIEVPLTPGVAAELVLPASDARADWRMHASIVTLPSRDVPGSLDARTLGALVGQWRFACAAPAAH